MLLVSRVAAADRFAMLANIKLKPGCGSGDGGRQGLSGSSGVGSDDFTRVQSRTQSSVLGKGYVRENIAQCHRGRGKELQRMVVVIGKARLGGSDSIARTPWRCLSC